MIFDSKDPTQPNPAPPTALLISARERRVEGPAGTDTYDHDPPTKLGAIPSPTGSHPASPITPKKFRVTPFLGKNLLPLTQVGSLSIFGRAGFNFARFTRFDLLLNRKV